ncbi:MAG: hypothetical protein SGI77_20570 [Pirellulaceae bacterium]|nr:hypothetical protein [Pirellulaceae bacterium]
MKTEYSLLKNFTKHGVWWLPGRPEDRVRGDLVFDGNDAKLKLFGAFEGTESVFVNRDAEMILGSCGNEDITLLNCGLGERWDVMMDSITSTWWCQFALIGLHAAGGLEHGFIRLETSSFSRVQLHRNNRHYRLLIHVCRLLHDLFLPDQQTGSRRFRHVLEQETLMHRVFETFVRQFAIRHCPDAKVSAMKIKWDGYSEASDEVRKVLPNMLTDVTLSRPHRKTILDCKFYKDALVTRHDRHRLHSSHLYQLVAYLKNKSLDPGWESVDGILLYPAVDHQFDLTFSLLGHQVAIKSIDLDQDWPKIHQRLLSVLSASASAVSDIPHNSVVTHNADI